MSTAPMRLRRCSAPNGRDGQNPGRHEFMAGARQDPGFGPGAGGGGGEDVQRLPDNAVVIPPFDSADVYAALKTLRIAPLLDGVRGEPPLDAAALCAGVIALCPQIRPPSDQPNLDQTDQIDPIDPIDQRGADAVIPARLGWVTLPLDPGSPCCATNGLAWPGRPARLARSVPG